MDHHPFNDRIAVPIVYINASNKAEYRIIQPLNCNDSSVTSITKRKIVIIITPNLEATKIILSVSIPKEFNCPSLKCLCFF